MGLGLGGFDLGWRLHLHAAFFGYFGGSAAGIFFFFDLGFWSLEAAKVP